MDGGILPYLRCRSMTTNLPIASASAVVVESTSVRDGLTKTRYARSVSSAWSVEPRKRKSSPCTPAASFTAARSSPLPKMSTRTPSRARPAPAAAADGDGSSQWSPLQTGVAAASSPFM